MCSANFFSSPSASGVCSLIELGLCLVLGLRLFLLDRTKIVAAGTDLLRMHHAAVFGFDAVASYGDPRIRRKELGNLFSLLRSDTDHGVVGEQRAAKLRSEEHTSELQSRSDLVCRL